MYNKKIIITTPGRGFEPRSPEGHGLSRPAQYHSAIPAFNISSVVFKIFWIILHMEFVKMHGNGNDFVLIDEFNGIKIPNEKKSEFVRALCDRRFGVGGDGAIFVQKSEVADAKFVFYNNDGSMAEMCGNGIRCFARYIVEKGYAKEGRVSVETLTGIIHLNVWFDEKWWIKVDMGKPKFEGMCQL